jgi:hypothetical protein
VLGQATFDHARNASGPEHYEVLLRARVRV